VSGSADPAPAAATPPAEVREALVRMGLVRADADARYEPLMGGVSSDIWKVSTGDRVFCVKRALPRLRVEAEWNAPVERNAYEVRYYRTVRATLPDAAPEVLGEDREAGLFAMAFLAPEAHPLWKTRLRDGEADTAFARAVGDTLGSIHAATAGDEEVRARFDTGEIFHALRLEPYLLATARAQPRFEEALEALAQTTARSRHALVHGDASPKNILAGPCGPVLLDAECAWYGDPAFDAAFCLNHLLLKCLWNPSAKARFHACFEALAEAWLARVDWEPRVDAERRVARLLPALMLARVDGKSPVEYLTEARDRDLVRHVAGVLLAHPVRTLDGARAAWGAALGW